MFNRSIEDIIYGDYEYSTKLEWAICSTSSRAGGSLDYTLRADARFPHSAAFSSGAAFLQGKELVSITWRPPCQIKTIEQK